ncbi:hypothetical protein TNCV_2883091 [Trichonephila clavipes]|nr:hypothetical protein TNCV_2883091 [Trichonephila clavipes]
MERQVWNIVAEIEIEPKLDVSTDAKAAKEVKNFKARKQIAMSIIYLNIDSSHRRIVERIDDPVDAWKVLKTYYQPDSKAHHMELKKQDKLKNMGMNKEIAAQSTRIEPKKRSTKTCYQCNSPDHLKNNCPELTSRQTTMNNYYRSPRHHFTPRNVKGSYQHRKRCQSPTRTTRLLINVITSTTETLSPEPHSEAVLEPVYLKFELFEPFPDEDSRHERIVKDASDKFSEATPG